MSVMPSSQYGSYLKALLLRAEISQNQFSRKMEMPASTLAMQIQGRRLPPHPARKTKWYAKAEKVLGCSTDECSELKIMAVSLHEHSRKRGISSSDILFQLFSPHLDVLREKVNGSTTKLAAREIQSLPVPDQKLILLACAKLALKNEKLFLDEQGVSPKFVLELTKKLTLLENENSPFRFTFRPNLARVELYSQEKGIKKLIHLSVEPGLKPKPFEK